MILLARVLLFLLPVLSLTGQKSALASELKAHPCIQKDQGGTIVDKARCWESNFVYFCLENAHSIENLKSKANEDEWQFLEHPVTDSVRMATWENTEIRYFVRVYDFENMKAIECLTYEKTVDVDSARGRKRQEICPAICSEIDKYLGFESLREIDEFDFEWAKWQSSSNGEHLLVSASYGQSFDKLPSFSMFRVWERGAGYGD